MLGTPWPVAWWQVMQTALKALLPIGTGSILTAASPVVGLAVSLKMAGL